MPRLALAYLTRFECIAERCEDTCCSGLLVPLTTPDRERLAGALGPQVDERVVPLETKLDGHPFRLARGEDGACRSLEQGLCSLVRAHGAGVLSDACTRFPRTFQVTPTGTVAAATLACPEIARRCLLDPDATTLVTASDELTSRWPSTQNHFPDETSAAGWALLQRRGWSVRERLLQLVALAEGVEVVRPELPGAPVMETMVAMLTGLLPARTSVRFRALVTLVLTEYQAAALARAPDAGEPGGPAFNDVLWTIFRERADAIDASLGSWLEGVRERYWQNDWHRVPWLGREAFRSRAFAMVLKAAVLNFLLAGHPAVLELALISAERALTAEEQARLDEAVVETVQIFAKNVERDADLFSLVEQHFSALAPLERAWLFARAA